MPNPSNGAPDRQKVAGSARQYWSFENQQMPPRMRRWPENLNQE
jgi:hypothetical protein